MLSPVNLLILTFLSLLATFFLTATSSAFRKLHKKGLRKMIDSQGKLFFYRHLHRLFFQEEFNTLLLATACAQNLTRFCYSALAIIFLFNSSWLLGWGWVYISLGILIFIIISLLIADFLPRQCGSQYPSATIKISAPFVALLLSLTFPINYIFIKLSQCYITKHSKWKTSEQLEQAKERIFEIIKDAAENQTLEPQEKKLIESVVTFRDRIVREVMIPRVDLFCLAADTSIKDAAKALEEEGYSRVPIYNENIDNIIGILMYKDILAKYMEAEQKNDHKIVEVPVETIMKNVLYTPETKKISHLLQEFRNRQVHFAIVVDEYGGTKGIVTIEDILEEIVGEIVDEYDEEEVLFHPLSSGGWIVDARMTILDIEEELGVKIPQDGDYDSIGGYIFHRAGTIPSKGFIVEHDDFKIEILSSNDRCIEKVKLIPTIRNRENR